MPRVRRRQRCGEQDFEGEEEAVQKLAELQKSKKRGIADAALAEWIRLLVAADRQLAQTAITDAAAGDPKSLAEAAKELAKGDAEGGAGMPTPRSSTARTPGRRRRRR